MSVIVQLVTMQVCSFLQLLQEGIQVVPYPGGVIVAGEPAGCRCWLLGTEMHVGPLDVMASKQAFRG